MWSCQCAFCVAMCSVTSFVRVMCIVGSVLCEVVSLSCVLCACRACFSSCHVTRSFGVASLASGSAWPGWLVMVGQGRDGSASRLALLDWHAWCTRGLVGISLSLGSARMHWLPSYTRSASMVGSDLAGECITVLYIYRICISFCF